MKEPDFQPLADYMLVELIKNNQTAGGLALPDGAENGPPRGRVLAVGPGVHTTAGSLIPMQCQPGDVVYVSNILSQPICVELDGKEYFLVRDRDSIGMVRRKAA